MAFTQQTDLLKPPLKVKHIKHDLLYNFLVTNLPCFSEAGEGLKNRDVRRKISKRIGEGEDTISNHLEFKLEYAIKLTFQSSVVTSLLFSFVLPLTCFNTNTFGGSLSEADLHLPSGIDQIRAVESPDLQLKL